MDEKIQEILSFWNPRDFDHARQLIIDVPDWTQLTEWVMPLLLTDHVRDNVRYGNALEIGCGVGRLLRPMSKYFFAVVGIDIAPNMVELSREYLRDVPNAHAQLCDGHTFPIDNDTMDFIYSVIVFQHIPYREMVQQYLRESLRVLRKGGLARIQTHIGIPTPRFNGFWGCFYPSLEKFAQEFTDTGFEIVEKEFIDPYLWVTARKP